jgi:chaperonin GroEL
MAIYSKMKAKYIVADQEQINNIVSKALGDMSKIVSTTLGPGGRPVLIERDGLSPLVTKDGVTVAKSVGVKNAEANIVVEAAREICINTAKDAGDGTTTAIILANALLREGQSFMKDRPKYNPQRIVNELQDAYNKVVIPYLKDNAVKVTKEEDLRSVAKISANGDELIANSVVKAIMAAGEDGTVLIEENQGAAFKVETIEGFIVTTGLKELGSIGPIFINDKANQQVKMDAGLVFLYDGSMNDLQVPAHIQTAIEEAQMVGKPLVVFAHQFSDVVLDRFAKTAKGGMTVVPVKTPQSGLPNGRSLFLHDMAAYTGATVYDPGILDQVDIDGFGDFDSAKVNTYESFIGCNNLTAEDSDRIAARVKELKSISESAFSEMDRAFIRAAIAKLTGGVSTIFVGGTSDLEIREKKGRVEDAVEAVRSAISEGIVPGGCGVQLVLANLLEQHPEAKPSWSIMSKALRKPIEILLSNCGEDIDEVWPMLQPHLKTKGLPKTIFDANEHKMVDPFAAGIIEPAKVCRVAICNALSVASLLTTLGGLVVVPRSEQLEMQMDIANQAFKDMMNASPGEQND